MAVLSASILLSHGLPALLFGVICTWLWQRRGFYAASWRMSGPLAWPLFGNAMLFWDIPNIHKTIWTVWKRHGCTMRFWLFQKFIVFLTKPQHLEFVMNAPETSDRGQVSSIIDDIIGLPGLFTSRGEVWKHHRKCLNPTMHFKIVNTYYPKFNKWCQELVDALTERADNGTSFDMFDYLDRTTLSMICDSLFDLPLDAEVSEDAFNMLHAVNNLMQNIGLKMYQPWYNIKPIFRISKYYDEFQRSIAGIDTFLRMLMAKRFREAHETIAIAAQQGLEPDVVNGRIPKPDNYVQHCMRLVEGKLMSYEEIIAETKTMLAGGFETTANTGAYIVLMLAMHPELQQRVYDELVDVLPHSDSPLLAEHVPRLVYTDRFIKETLRMFPVVPLASRYADADATFEDLHIPKGTEIILGIYYMQRDSTIWGPDADVFDPERFQPDRMAAVHPYAFVPFSAGFHHCIGARYGNLVLRMFVAWLVRHYRFETALRLADLRFRMDITLKLLNGHMVTVKRREPF